MRDCLTAPQGMYVMPGWHKPRECPSLNPLLMRNRNKPADCESGDESGFLKLNPGFFCVKHCEWMNESTSFFPCINPIACRNISYVPVGGIYDINASASAQAEGRFNYSVTCETGYSGILCGACAKGYGETTFASALTCSTCPDPALNIVLVVAFLLFVIALVVFIVQKKMKKNRASLTRIMLTFLQFMSYSSFLTTMWPDPVLGMYEIQETVTSSSPSWMSMDCLITRYLTGADNQQNSILLQTRMTILDGPLIVFACLAVWCIVRYAIEVYASEGLDFYEPKVRKEIQENARTTAIVTFVRTAVILEWLMWSTVVKNIFKLFKCVNYDTARLEIDLQMKCWQGDHTRQIVLYAMPAIVIHILGFPAVILYVLYAFSSNKEHTVKIRQQVQMSKKNKGLSSVIRRPTMAKSSLRNGGGGGGGGGGNATQTATASARALASKEEGARFLLEAFGFLVAGYRQEVMWWEITVLFRRICVLACLVFLHEYQQVQVATVFLILASSLYLHLRMRPYDLHMEAGHEKAARIRGDLADLLERWSLVCLLSTLLSAFYFMGEITDRFFLSLLGVVVVLINLVYMCYFIYYWSLDKYTKAQRSMKMKMETLSKGADAGAGGVRTQRGTSLQLYENSIEMTSTRR